MAITVKAEDSFCKLCDIHICVSRNMCKFPFCNEENYRTSIV